MDYVNSRGTIIKKVPFSQAKRVINELYQLNDMMSCFQSYDYLSITGKGFLDKNPLEMLFWSDVTYIQYHNQEVVSVIPLLIRKGKMSEIKIRGAFTSAGCLDIIYKTDWSYDDFVDLMSFIKKDIPNAYLRTDRLSEGSLFLKYSKRYWNLTEDKVRTQKCVSIPIPDSFDEWYRSLSKNVRQNYRTSLNRLKNDQYQYRLDLFWDKPMDRKRYRNTTNLYCQRLAEYNTSKEWLQKAIIVPLRFMKIINPMSRTFYYMDNCFDAELYINEELAAVCCGYISRPDRVIVPRFFINTKFSRYSPGGLLIAEIVKKVNEINMTSKEGVRVRQLDLSRGNEKYKYSYGGIEYITYGFEIKL